MAASLNRKDSKDKGKDLFIEYYSSLFGDEADLILQSLEEQSAPILRVNPLPAQQELLHSLWEAAGIIMRPLSWYPNALLWPKEIPFGEQIPGIDEGLLYAMNASSLLPVIALDPQPNETILDACAAPGGKTLIISDAMKNTGALVASDTSPVRRGRLQQLLTTWGQYSVRVAALKAEIVFKRYPNTFDRILADVPCSSEKHVWNSTKHLDVWSPNRVKQLSQRQLAILGGLFEALAPGGRLVYSTCAITPEENEYVIDRFLKKKKGRAVLVPWSEAVDSNLNIPKGDGVAPLKEVSFDLSAVNRILPHRLGADNPAQHDPMFVAIITKAA